MAGEPAVTPQLALTIVALGAGLAALIVSIVTSQHTAAPAPPPGITLESPVPSMPIITINPPITLQGAVCGPADNNWLENVSDGDVACNEEEVLVNVTLRMDGRLQGGWCRPLDLPLTTDLLACGAGELLLGPFLRSQQGLVADGHCVPYPVVDNNSFVVLPPVNNLSVSCSPPAFALPRSISNTGLAANAECHVALAPTDAIAGSTTIEGTVVTPELRATHPDAGIDVGAPYLAHLRFDKHGLLVNASNSTALALTTDTLFGGPDVVTSAYDSLALVTIGAPRDCGGAGQWTSVSADAKGRVTGCSNASISVTGADIAIGSTVQQLTLSTIGSGGRCGGGGFVGDFTWTPQGRVNACSNSSAPALFTTANFAGGATGIYSNLSLAIIGTANAVDVTKYANGTVGLALASTVVVNTLTLTNPLPVTSGGTGESSVLTAGRIMIVSATGTITHSALRSANMVPYQYTNLSQSFTGPATRTVDVMVSVQGASATQHVTVDICDTNAADWSAGSNAALSSPAGLIPTAWRPRTLQGCAVGAGKANNNQVAMSICVGASTGTITIAPLVSDTLTLLLFPFFSTFRNGNSGNNIACQSVSYWAVGATLPN